MPLVLKGLPVSMAWMVRPAPQVLQAQTDWTAPPVLPDRLEQLAQMEPLVRQVLQVLPALMVPQVLPARPALMV